MSKRLSYYSILSLILLSVAFYGTSCRFSQAFHSQPVRPYNNPNGGIASNIDTSDYIQLKYPPDDIKTSTAAVFLESVERIIRPDTAFMIINGNFSNGCSNLQKVSHSIESNVLHIHFEAWQPKNEMCTQALTPFSYLYNDLSAEKVRSLRFYIKQGKKIAF